MTESGSTVAPQARSMLAPRRVLGLPPRWLLAAIAMGALLLGSVGVRWLMRGSIRMIGRNQPIITGLPGNIEMRLNNVVFRGVSGGKIVWEVAADHFDVAKDQYTFRASALKRIALLKDGHQELTVSADSLERNILTGDIALAGLVTVQGKDILLRTPNIVWNDRMQIFTIPGQLDAQIGEITLSSAANTVYNVSAATVHADGHIHLAVQRNSFDARGVTINIVSQSFTIDGPAHAQAVVGDVQQWGNGQHLPQIPAIPAPIKERYQAYLRKHGM